MSSVGQPIDDRVREILERRARQLARPPASPRPTDLLELVAFQLGRERYGIETRWIAELASLRTRSALPGAPPPIAGLTSLRGEILTLIDLRSSFGLPANALDDLARIVVLERESLRLGLLIDRLEGIVEISRTELHPSPGNGQGPRPFLGVTADGLIVLDIEELLALFEEDRP